jgi:hypothetical protein
MSVDPTVLEGSAVTLNVEFQDSRDLNHDVLVTWGDGTTSTLSLINDERSFQLSHTYLDDSAIATPGRIAPIDVTITAGSLIVGDQAVFVLDISGSTADGFAGSPVGDRNGDGDSDTILDAQIAGFQALNQRLIDLGRGNTTQVSIVAFSSTAGSLDMNPSVDGVQLAAMPLADTNGNGIRDVDEALASLDYGGTTNFEAALGKAITTLNMLGTPAGEGTVVFLSDGYPNTGGAYDDEVNTLRNTMGMTLRAFGVGTSSSLPALQQIDPAAVQFTTTDELIGVFSGTGSGGQVGGGTATGRVETQVLNVAPVVSAGGDRSINEGATVTWDAVITDPGADTHTVNWTVTNSTGEVVAVGSGTIFVYQPPAAGTYTATVTVTDDDVGVGTDMAILTVTAVAGEEVVGPRVIQLQRLGRCLEPTRLVLTFDQTLNRVSAQRLRNYRLLACGPDREFGTADDVAVPLTGARYRAAGNKVVLRAACPLGLQQRFRLITNGSKARGIRGVNGAYLDGQGDGHAGTDYVRIFNRSILVTRKNLAAPALT